MSMSATTLTLPAGADILITYPVDGGSSARFVPGTVRTQRHFEEADRLYGPASFLEGVTLPMALGRIPDFAPLGTEQFEQTLIAVATDALGPEAAERLAVLREQHHLVIVDSHILDAG